MKSVDITETVMTRIAEAEVLDIIIEKTRLRGVYGYRPATVAYYADIDSGVPTSVSSANIRRALSRLKRRGIVRYVSRVGWVLVDEDRTLCTGNICRDSLPYAQWCVYCHARQGREA